MAALNEELISEDEEELSGEDAHPNKDKDKQMWSKTEIEDKFKY